MAIMGFYSYYPLHWIRYLSKCCGWKDSSYCLRFWQWRNIFLWGCFFGVERVVSVCIEVTDVTSKVLYFKLGHWAKALVSERHRSTIPLWECRPDLSFCKNESCKKSLFSSYWNKKPGMGRRALRNPVVVPRKNLSSSESPSLSCYVNTEESLRKWLWQFTAILSVVVLRRLDEETRSGRRLDTTGIGEGESNGVVVKWGDLATC